MSVWPPDRSQAFFEVGDELVVVRAHHEDGHSRCACRLFGTAPHVADDEALRTRYIEFFGYILQPVRARHPACEDRTSTEHSLERGRGRTAAGLPIASRHRRFSLDSHQRGVQLMAAERFGQCSVGKRGKGAGYDVVTKIAYFRGLI